MRASLRSEPRTMNPGARRWCEDLPDVAAELDCGGQRHRVVWRRGKLVLEDHDLLAERSLVALGAEPPLCVELLDAWRGLRGPRLLRALVHRGTVPIEELASRRIRHAGAIDRATHFIAGPGQVLRGLLANAKRDIEREKRTWAITLLRALPVEFRHRLALAVIVEIGRHWHDEQFRREHREHVDPVLGAIAGACVERSARYWRRDLEPHAGFVIGSHVVAPGESTRCTVRFDADGGAGTVSLPLAWFSDVWARELAIVDECFVTRRAGHGAAPAILPVLALRWEREDHNVSRSVEAPALLTRGDDGAWALHWV